MLVLEKFVDKYKSAIYLFVVFIIAVSTLIPIFSHSYFTMHDDQHIARLYLLDQGINQGIIYPRWVDQLGFNYGYPLFNFYPPFIYYVAEFFRSLGFGYMYSLKLMLLVGAVVGSFGVYFFTKKLYGSISGVVATMLFTFFSYRAITVYVRGAFAEYWALSLFPWVLITLYNLYITPSRKNALLAGATMALLILAHPFVALPGMFFAVSFISLLFLMTEKSERLTFSIHSVQAIIAGLALSAFFWLPSMVERAYTLVDTILLRELASYSIHFVYPQQLWYSAWGFGGSVEGLGDGLSFQISKPYLGLLFTSLVLWIWMKKFAKKKFPHTIETITSFILLMLTISIFLLLPYSKPVWDAVRYLQYLQFPWRFMAFVGFFLSVFCASIIYFVGSIPNTTKEQRWRMQLVLSSLIFLIVFLVQAKYFKPQRFLNSTDVERTSFKEIAWRISSSSFEFVPKGVKTTKTPYNTTTLAIQEKEIADTNFKIIAGEATVATTSDRFDFKRFSSDAPAAYLLEIQTYNFPGWHAYIDGREERIDDDNDFKLIRLHVPSGRHTVEIKNLSTPIQRTSTYISVAAWLYFFSYLYLSIGKSRRSRQKSIE
jgi:hypothetical protein